MHAWPMHGLVLSTPTLTLRGLTEAGALALASVVPEDLDHDPRFPELTSAQKSLRSYWQAQGQWSADDWVLQLAVVVDGEPVGLQALEGKDFAVRRTVDSYSWLVPSVRGKGVGKRMRAAVLELAFAHLGAEVAVSEAWEDNAASLGVSRSLGYRDNGLDIHRRDGGPGRMQRLLLERADWQAPEPVTVAGLEACLPLLGISPGPDQSAPAPAPPTAS